ncbi:type VII secretion protein EccB [Microbacterium sp. GXF7504]
MATKSDLIEAQNFSRRRLLTAFVSGAPGGKELEPTAPLRAVIAAIALTVGVVLVGVFYGLIRPGLPSGWDNGKLILVSDTGARFVTIEGGLHPVINTASARLLLPASGFEVITTDQQNLAGVSVGETLGIVGAPDELPAPDRLRNSGWSACVTDDVDLAVRVGGKAPRTTDGAVVVEVDGDRYIVAGDRAFPVAADASDAVLRAAGITALSPVEVSAQWLNLFVAGTPLEPITVDAAGERVDGTDLRVGDVVHIRSTPDDERLLVLPDGTLADLTPLAWRLYQLGDGAELEGVVEVSSSAIADIPSAATAAGGADWPADGFTALPAEQRPCAVLDGSVPGGRTLLAGQDAQTPVAPGVEVAAGRGALVDAGGRGDQRAGILTLVDETGTAFPVPGATEETVNRLGYDMDDAGAAPQGWIALFQTGPALTEEAAGTSPGRGDDG